MQMKTKENPSGSMESSIVAHRASWRVVLEALEILLHDPRLLLMSDANYRQMWEELAEVGIVPGRADVQCTGSGA